MSFWQSVKKFFTGRPQPISTGSTTEEARHQTPAPDQPVIALACGDVYEFRVYADIEWSTRAMSYDQLVRQAGERSATVAEDLRRRVWREARRHRPHEAAAAEDAIRRSLGSWCYETDYGTIKCTPTVRVWPDPRVQEHLTPYALRSIDLDSERILSLQRAGSVQEMVERWRRVLLDLRAGVVTVHAAQLSDPGFATVVGRLADRRRQSVLELVEVLDRSVKDHEQVGLFEFAEMYANAIVALQRQLDIEESELVEQMMDPPMREPSR
ncbi:hypothetical protein [Actinoplanes sp. TFC3]|uniref:hypothetical protein n=1 Tax=Actinoplanes sp. TFC3 TaxID=1710355 RepID=UPI00083604F6|nr:hypothetical protein [Actinoplanes sp. TFC3]